jgi:hypothetical protein
MKRILTIAAVALLAVGVAELVRVPLQAGSEFSRIPLRNTAAVAQQKQFKDIVQEINATIEPAEAKPGQTVTWKLTAKLIPDWHTYPAKQIDKNAADSVTKFDFSDLKKVGLNVSGAMKDPPKFKKKAEPTLKIKELRYYEGEVVWTQQLKLAADVKPGKHKLPVKVTMQVCDEKGCLPPETVMTEAEITVK